MVQGRDSGQWLTLDRGNTTLDIALSQGPGRTLRRARIEPGVDAILDFVGGASITQALTFDVRADAERDALVAEACRRLGVALRRAGDDVGCPLELDYGRPETLGVDRWVAAVAARAGWGDAVIVDCGTAVTVDAVTRDGRFIGGAIGAGLRAMADGLAGRAPRLPTLGPSTGVPGPGAMPTTSSAAAVEVGLLHGFAGSVHALVDRLLDVWPAPERAPAVLLCGGDAAVVEALAQRAFAVVPDLLHRGMRELLSGLGSGGAASHADG